MTCCQNGETSNRTRPLAAQHCPHDRAAPAVQRSAADDHGGDGIQFITQARVGRRGIQTRRHQQSGHPGQRTAEHIDHQLDAVHIQPAHPSHLHELVIRHAGRGSVTGDFRELGFHRRRAGVELVCCANDLGQIHRGDTDAMAFKDLLRVANRVERPRSRPNRAEADAAQSVHDAADGEELLQVALEAVGRRMRNVLAGERELDASLDEIVADGNLAAKRIAPARRHELVRIVGIALDEHGHIEPGELEGVSDAFLVTEVRQAHEHAVDFIRVFLEEFRALAGVIVRLDAAELGVLFLQLDGVDAELGEELCDIRPRLGDKCIGEKITVAVEDAKRGGLDKGRAHVSGNNTSSVTKMLPSLRADCSCILRFWA